MRTVALLSLMAIVACDGTEDPPVDGEVVITGQLNDLIARVGETVETDVLIRDGAGNPITRFTWERSGPDGDYVDVEVNEADGSIHFSYTVERSAPFAVSGHVVVNDLNHDVGVALSGRGWGGAPGRVVPAHMELRLVEGEVRPTFGFAVPAEPGRVPYATLGAFPEEMSYTSADASVATVSDAGFVTAVAAGETTLTIRWEGASADVPVVVETGELGPPPLGDFAVPDGIQGWRSFAAAQIRSGIRNDVATRSPGRVGFDARGYPMVAATLEPDLEGGDTYAWPVLIHWTGSGWGARLVGRPWVTAIEERLAVDADGVAWMAYWEWTDEHTPVVARVDDEGVSYFDLDHPLAETEYARDLGFDGDIHLAPREGGGAWLLISTHGEHLTDVDAHTGLCDNRLYLVEYTGASSDVHTVVHQEIEYGPGDACPEIVPRDLVKNGSRLALMPPGDGETLPRVVADAGWALDCFTSGSAPAYCNLPVVTLARGPERWAPVDPVEVDMDNFTDRGSYQFQAMSAARDVSDPNEARLVLSYTFVDPHADRDVEREHQRNMVLSDAEVFAAEGPWVTRGAFSFRKDGATFLSGSYFTTMLMMRRDGYGSEEPYQRGVRIEESYAYDEGRGPITAWGVTEDRLYLLDGPARIFALPLPQDVSDASDDDETTGARLGDDIGTPSVWCAPAILSDGRRFILGHEQAAPVDTGSPFDPPLSVPTTAFVSAGPGAPFVGTVLSVEADNVLVPREGGERVRAVGDDLYSMHEGQLLRSADLGVTWEDVGADADDYEGWDVGPDGRFVGVHRAGSSWTFTVDDDLRDGFTPVTQGPVTFAGQRSGPILGQDGNVYFVDGFNGTMKLLRVVDGVADPLVEIDLGGFTRNSFPGVGYVMADGTLIAPIYDLMEDLTDGFDPMEATLHVLRRDGATGETTIETLGPMSPHNLGDQKISPIGIVELTDGTLVIGWTMEEEDLLILRAVVTASADGGMTWGAPILLRPTGGHGQLFIGMSPEPSGGLVAVLADNGSISGDVSNAPQRWPIYASPAPGQSDGSPRMEDIVVRMDW